MEAIGEQDDMEMSGVGKVTCSYTSYRYPTKVTLIKEVKMKPILTRSFLIKNQSKNITRKDIFRLGRRPEDNQPRALRYLFGKKEKLTIF